MNKKMTTEKKAQRVAAGKSTPRTWQRNWGNISFVVFSVVFVCFSRGISFGQPFDWPIFRSNAQLSAQAQVDGPLIPDLFWVKTIGLEKIQSPVVASDGTIVFTSRGDHFVYALNPDNSIKWKFSHPAPGGNNNETFSAPAALGSDGTVYVGSHEGGFFAIDANGKLKWRVSVVGYVATAPNLDKNGNIYLAVDDTQLYVFDPAGKLLCIGSLDGLKPANTPAIASSGTVYVPAGNSIFVFNSSCARLARWILPNLGEVAWVVLSADGRTLHAGSTTNSLVLALDAQTGKQLWSYSYNSSYGPPSPPALGPDGSIHFAGINAGLLIALAPNGSEKWTFDLGSSRYKTMPVVDASGNVYIVNESSNFGLFKLSSSGSELWRLPNVQCDYSIAIGPDGTLYIPSRKKIYAVRHQPPFADSLAFLDGNGQAGCIDSVLAKPIRARVFDQYGNPFPGQPVRFRVIVGGGAPQDTTVLSDSNGFAQIDWQLGSLLGEQKLEISSTRNGTPLKGSPIMISAIAHGPAIGGEAEVIFKTTAVNDTSDTTYVIRNLSDCILTIDRLLLANGTHFSIKPPPISNVPIPPGGQLEVTLVFAPSVVGSLVDTLLIFSNDAAQPRFAVVLSGEAIAQPEIVVNPISFEFGEVMVGNDSTQPITISNIGTALLVISDFDFSDPAYRINLAPPVSITAGDSVPGKITFTPADGRPYPATLKIASNDPKRDTVVVALNGRGKRMPKILVQPDTLAFGKVCLDSCRTLSVKISNIGNDTLVIDSLATVDSMVFKVEPGEIRLLPGESVVVSVAFCPKEAKNYAGTLSIFSNDPDDSIYVVKLFGEGLVPKVVLDPIPPLLEVCAGELVSGVLNIINDSDCALEVDSIKFVVVPIRLAALQSFADAWQTAAVGLIIPPHGTLPFSYSVPAPSVNFEVRFRVRSNGMPDPAEITIPGRIIPPAIAGDDSVNFGTVFVGDSKTLDAKVWNDGKCEVRIDSAVVAGRDFFAFSVDASSLPKTLQRLDTLRLPVTFSPKDTGEHVAVLLVYNNDPNNNPLEIVLIGNGELRGPVIEVSPDPLAFGVQCDTTYQDVVISNTGHDTLKVTDLIFDNPAFFTKHAKQFPVLKGDSETVAVGYAPKVGLSANGILTVQSNATKKKSTVALSGTGGEPDIAGASEVTFDPVKVQICNGKPGDTTAIYWIKNDGTCDLEITGLLTSAPFAVTMPATPQTIKPGDSLAVTLAFAPSDSGSFNGTLRILSNDPDASENPFEVALHGLGLSEPEIEVQPVVVDFDTVCALDSSLVKVFNRGHNILRVTNLVFTDTAFSTTHATNFTVAPCDSQMIWVYFTPTPGEVDTGSLAIHSDDVSEPVVTVELKGEGGKPVIAGTPSPLEFPVVNIRECAAGEQDSSAATFEIRNLGACDLVISSFRVDGDFSLAPITVPLIIPANGSKSVTLHFKPKAAGNFTGALHVFSNDPDTPDLVVPLNGTATAVPQIATQPPDTLRFFGVRVDSSAEKFIDVSNVGSGILRVDNILITGTVFTTTTATPFELVCDSTKSVNVIFKPTDDVAYIEKLTFVSNDPATPNKVVVLVGIGTLPPPPGPPNIVVTPKEIDFGTGLCGAATDTVFVSNTGEDTLHVTALVFTNSAFSTMHARVFDVLSGATDTIVVVFSPEYKTSYNDSLLIHSNDPDEPIVGVALKGTSGAPDIDADNSKMFPNVRVETCSGMRNRVSLDLKLSNRGDCPLAISSFQVRPPFSVAASTPLVIPEAPGSETVVLIFTPLADSTYTDTLFVYSDDPDEPVFKVVLTGRGVFLPNLEVKPVTLDYASIRVGTTVDSLVVVRNLGAAQLVVNDITVAGPAFRIDNDKKEFVLSCNADSVIVLVFAPPAVGVYRDTLRIWHNDASKQNPFLVPLHGVGISGNLVACKAIEFPELCVENVDSAFCELKNNGSLPLTINNVRLSEDEIAFTLKQPLPVGELAPNESKKLWVKFNPHRSGLAKNAVVVDYALVQGLTRQTTLELSGNALPNVPKLEVTSSFVDFGKVPLDSVVQQTLTFTNVGCSLLVLNSFSPVIDKDAFVVSAPPTPVHLPRGASVSVLVEFSAYNFGLFKDAFTVANTDPTDENKRINLLAEVNDGDICLEPEYKTLDFGEVLVNKEKPLLLGLKNCTDRTRIRVRVFPEKLVVFTAVPAELPIFMEATQFLTVVFKPEVARVYEDSLVLEMWRQDDSTRSDVEIKKVFLVGKGIGAQKVEADPNAFTPNEDGVNDEAKIVFPSEKFVRPALHIFDMRGLRVRYFEEPNRNEDTFAWNGRSESGELQLPGSYLWILEDQGKKIGSGQIVLIR